MSLKKSPSAVFAHVAALAAFAALLSAGSVQAQDADDRDGTPSVFTGMVEIPAGEFKMGVKEDHLRRTYMKTPRTTHPLLLGKSKDTWWPILLWETAEHKASTEAYAIDRYEVTNAQYLAFLEDCCRKSLFTTKKLNTIRKIATELYPKVDPWEIAAIYWLNEEKLQSLIEKIRELNVERIAKVIAEFNDGRPDPVKIKDLSGLNEKLFIEAWMDLELPEETGLTIYTRWVPEHWKKARPSKEQLDCPVRDILYLDAAAFAVWAGKHIPTEQEWEKAARGPKSWLYPWGDTWDAEHGAQKNWIIWSGAAPAPTGPASKHQDRPIAVGSIPEGRSGYGCHDMLGNVYEWTSTIPWKYPKSDAVWSRFGGDRYRVARGGCWGTGSSSDGRELQIRNTARYFELGYPLTITSHILSVGFRCAKYETPARDCMVHWPSALKTDGLLPEGVTLDPARAFGAEQIFYAAGKSENHVYVEKETGFIGLIPVERLPYNAPKEVVGASAKNAEDASKPPVLFAYLQWNGNPRLQAYEVSVEKAKPTEGEEAPAEDVIVEKPIDLHADGTGYMVGLYGGRLALFEMRLSGVKFRAYLTPKAPEGQKEREVVRKIAAKQFPRQAVLNAGKKRLEVALPISTRSKTSKDLFGVEFNLVFDSTFEGPWRDTPAGK